MNWTNPNFNPMGMTGRDQSPLGRIGMGVTAVQQAKPNPVKQLQPQVRGNDSIWAKAQGARGRTFPVGQMAGAKQALDAHLAGKLAECWTNEFLGPGLKTAGEAKKYFLDREAGSTESRPAPTPYNRPKAQATSKKLAGVGRIALRKHLIRKLAGDMPVALNLRILPNRAIDLGPGASLSGSLRWQNPATFVPTVYEQSQASKHGNDQWSPSGWKKVTDQAPQHQGPRGWNLRAIKGKAGPKTTMAAMYKQAVLEPMWGAAGGAYIAPKGQRLEGMLRGAGIGALSGLGGLGTGLAGYNLGQSYLPGAVNIGGYDVPKAALLGLASMLPGNAAGYMLGKRLMWPGGWQDPETEVRRRARRLVGLNNKESDR